jgi:glutaredoxin
VAADDHELTLLVRAGCGLCGPAKAALARVHAATGVPWSVVDVATDRELEREYGDRLPVILLDGAEHGYWKVQVDRLLQDLAR